MLTGFLGGRWPGIKNSAISGGVALTGGRFRVLQPPQFPCSPALVLDIPLGGPRVSSRSIPPRRPTTHATGVEGRSALAGAELAGCAGCLSPASMLQGGHSPTDLLSSSRPLSIAGRLLLSPLTLLPQCLLVASEGTQLPHRAHTSGIRQGARARFLPRSPAYCLEEADHPQRCWLVV